jgi:hypothetical protein
VEPLTSDERRLICPELEHPAVVLLGKIGDALPEVFPTDLDGYGIASAKAPCSPALAEIVNLVARMFDIPELSVTLVAARLGPTLEPSRPPLVLLPRSLEDVGRREQLYAVGSLLGRVAFRGEVTEPRRSTPTRPQLLEYLLWAACEIALPDRRSSAHGKPVFEDIKRRLARALPASAVESLRDSIDETTMDSIDGNFVQGVFDAASIRAGILAAQDPAIAAAALPRSGGVVAPEHLGVISFAVSNGYLGARRRLRLGVSR